jgi:alcohol dehydrogenase (NADP+)
LGAKNYVSTSDPANLEKLASQFDLILNTVSAPHEVSPFLQTLKRDGTMVLLGVPEKAPMLEAFNLIGGRRRIAGSLIGGIKETQEMLDFCSEKGITSDVEVIPIQKINEAYERMIKGDVKYRFVIDTATLNK